ncbi:MAG: UDP-N-acetylglucosamine 2-epimerase (non-hydrolyzing) [Proteobacteria bacterium]|nr:UDP-N-acetylglucosamine 2-epimerase (non-hydrolyzing) [Pseudomonadota bacterium]
MSHRIVTIVGARPQFIKAAALSRALRGEPGVEEWLVHTGQHFDDNMSEVFFRELDIPAPRFHLDIHGGPHGQMTGRMLEAIEQVLFDTRPALVLVYGDTNSTLAGALAAAKLHIPVAHVEAGLRSFNRRMPEEINRVLTDHVSALLFCPTFDAVSHLAHEGITAGVHHTGDIMYDATLHARSAAQQQSHILTRLALTPGDYVLCTLHRSENTDSEARLRALLAHVRETAGGRPVVLPLHPRTRQVLARFAIGTEGLNLVEPLGYFDMHALLGGAALVLTDSGGVQKEAYFHRVPCVTLRDDTEWTESLVAGWNRLWTQPHYVTPRVDIAEYGDGDAGMRMVALLRRFLDG